ncbi:MAG: response regulator [Bacteroidia bacterium]|nr:response regulator [Bacteroidia bacterium]MDW8347290.1 response regulator [Bacteroidia bacterium]
MAAKVFIVEDEFAIAMDIELKLSQMGYKVVGTADNYKDLLDFLSHTPADILLMDIHIKGDKNGIDIARELYQRRRIPIIFVTAFGDSKTFQEAMKTEPFGYLTKPFKDSDLQFAIEIALQKYKELHQQENYKSILNLYFDKGIVIFDNDLNILYYNSNALKLLKKQNLNEKKITAYIPDVLSFINKAEPSVYDTEDKTKIYVCQMPNDEHKYVLFLEQEQSLSNFETENTSPHDTRLNIDDLFFVRDRGRMISVKIKDILFLEAFDNYTTIVLDEKRVLASALLKRFADILPYPQFCRVHRSYIVAIDKITKIEDGHIYIQNHSIPIGKNYKDDLTKLVKVI